MPRSGAAPPPAGASRAAPPGRPRRVGAGLGFLVLALALGCGRRSSTRRRPDPAPARPRPPVAFHVAVSRSALAPTQRLAVWAESHRLALRLEAPAPDAAAALAPLFAGRVGVAVVARLPDDALRARLAASRLPLAAFPLGWDGVAVLAHPSNPLDRILRTDLGRALRGEVTSFGRLHGPALPLVPYVVAGEADLLAVLRAPLGLPGRLPARVREVADAATLLESVRRTPGGLGLLPLQALENPLAAPVGLKVFAVAEDPVAGGHLPLERAAVTRRDYALALPVVVLLRQDAKGGVGALRSLLCGESGAALGADLGLAPLAPEDRQRLRAAWSSPAVPRGP